MLQWGAVSLNGMLNLFCLFLDQGTLTVTLLRANNLMAADKSGRDLADRDANQRVSWEYMY